MKSIVVIGMLLCAWAVTSQVGINTTSPSSASVLDVNSSSNGVNFGGFLPPRVTVAQRDLIPVTAADDGMLIFVTHGFIKLLQIYDSVNAMWRTIYSYTTIPSTILAAWDVNGETGYGPSPFVATTSSPDVTVGGLARGFGVTTSGGGAANAWGGNGFDSTDQVAAIVAEDFVTFTITPNAGATVSLMAIAPYNIRRSGAGPTTGIWQYSLDGFNFTDITPPIIWGGNTAAAGNPQVAIDLSPFTDLQLLTSATTLTFRIVNWGASDPIGNWYINNITGNDLVIQGVIQF